MNYTMEENKYRDIYDCKRTKDLLYDLKYIHIYIYIQKMNLSPLPNHFKDKRVV